MADSVAVIETQRIVVRPWRLDEADRFFDMYRRPDVVRWLSAPAMQDRQEAVEMIELGQARLAQKRLTPSVYGTGGSPQIIWRLWHDHDTYDTNRHTAVQRLTATGG